MSSKKLFLIPSPIADNGLDTIPAATLKIIHELSAFITEKAKTTRRFISKTRPPYKIADLDILELNKHDSVETALEVSTFLGTHDRIGLLSEAGSPCIADPGSAIVRQARERGFDIIPLTGPNSIILALMASGLNGQAFRFHGYLPVKSPALENYIKKMASSAFTDDVTQIWIETPYRNLSMLQNLVKTIEGHLYLGLAFDLSGENESIRVHTIEYWKTNIDKIEIPKLPCIFLIGK